MWTEREWKWKWKEWELGEWKRWRCDKGVRYEERSPSGRRHEWEGDGWLEGEATLSELWKRRGLRLSPMVREKTKTKKERV